MTLSLRFKDENCDPGTPLVVESWIFVFFQHDSPARLLRARTGLPFHTPATRIWRGMHA